MDKKLTAPGAKALIIGLIMIIVSLAVYFSKAEVNSNLNLLVFGILMIGVVLSIIHFGKQVNHVATFGNYFAHGFKVASIVALIMIAYFLIFMWLFPDFKEAALTEIRARMLEDNDATLNQVEQSMINVKKGFWLFAIGGSILYNLFAGVIAALIGAAITEKGKKDFSPELTPTLK